jgi:glycosyltransferase involved in cell wall biosynthesis
VAVLSMLYGLFIMLRTLILGVDLPGYASVFTAVLFLGGLNMIGLGMLGEYLGRVFMEVKQRPLYVVADSHGLARGETLARAEPMPEPLFERALQADVRRR